MEKIEAIKVDHLSWEPHPFIPGVKIKVLLSNKKDNANLTIMLVRAPKGVEVPEHEHEGQDDIIYTLQGKNKMWVEGRGDFDLGPGSFIKIPRNVKHKPHDVVEDVLALDIFHPYLF